MILDHLSASRIKTFEQCQMKYHAVYELKLPETPHPLTLMGSSVHSMLELSSKARMAGQRRERWHDPMVFKQAAMRKFKVDDSLSSLIDELIDNAKRWGYFRNIHKTIGCELEFKLVLADGTNVSGFIDRLDLHIPEADIIDIKTQKKAFENDELRNNWQAKIYNMAVRELYPKITGKVSVSFWVLRHMVQKTWLTLEDAGLTNKSLMIVADQIRSCTDPIARPSGLCPYCPYYKDCKAANGNLKSRLKRWKN